MALESNDAIDARFEARGDFYLNEPMLLLADLSKNRERFSEAKIKVEVTRPTVALEQFLSRVPIGEAAPIKPLVRAERGVTPSWRDGVAAALAKEGVSRPTEKETIWLNDMGRDGDAIPRDGRYTGVYTDTGIGGIYSLRFVAETGPKQSLLHREKLVSVLVRPRIQTQPECSPSEASPSAQ